MANLGDVSVLNINGNEMTIKDAAVREVVSEIIEAIGANNTNIAERINDLHSRSFDFTLDITSNNDSELASIQDGVYKLHYVTVTGSGDNETRTLNNSAILIQKGTNQYLYKEGQIFNRTKTNGTWEEWHAQEISTVLSANYEMSSDSNYDLELEAGDTYEEAFGKIEKAINDNEIIIAASLNDLDSKINNIPTYDSSHKLSADLIEDGITNKVINVKPDWNAASGSTAEILNKPDLSNFLTIETQANWNETNTSSAAYIQNKPEIPVLVQSNWNETNTSNAAYILNKPTKLNDDEIDTIWSNSMNITIISFKINNISFKAETGMNWKEWINSEYNTNLYHISNSLGKIYERYGNYYVETEESVLVTPSDIIIQNHNYKHVHE